MMILSSEETQGFFMIFKDEPSLEFKHGRSISFTNFRSSSEQDFWASIEW